MRSPAQQEVDRWMALARAHGLVNHEGDVALGRFRTEPASEGRLKITFFTPVIAAPETEDLRPKTPPILFDRTPNGEIILPGRWWQHMLELLADMETVEGDVRRTAALAARHVFVEDALLPPDTDTIAMAVPDATGAVVTHEALPPGTIVYVNIQPDRRRESREEGCPMSRRGDGLRLMALLLLGGALLLNEQGDVVARVQERPGGSIDLFDADSNRIGWGRQSRTGDVELFDTRGNRLGIWHRDRGVIRLRK